jgi:hypothetical protein
MQVAAYEAALRFIHGGSGNSSLNRVLDVAHRISRCEMVAIMAVEGDSVRILASLNVPYAITNYVSVTEPSIKELFAKPQQISDLTGAMFKRSHPILSRVPNVSFIASHPLNLRLLPHQLVLVCIDTESKRKRPPDLTRWLGTVAAIFADELSLIGEVALLAEREVANHERHNFSLESVKGSSVPCVLIDAQLNVHGASEPLLKLIGCTLDDVQNTDMRKFIPSGYAFLLAHIERVATNFLDNSQTDFTTLDGERHFSLACIKLSFTGEKSFFTLLELRQIENNAHATATLPANPGDETHTITSEFLLRTLIRQRRLLHRGTAPYHVVNRWRKGVKDSQIAALRALKRNPPTNFVRMIAEEMAASAELLFGRNTFEAVSNVPCGHSGGDCLASRIAREVARIIGVPYRQAFECLDVSGSSHPAGNAKRPQMRLIETVDCPVLLVDDVATSGSHIAEAAKALRKSSPAVLPLVWIAD